jgi:hypothetical protein
VVIQILEENSVLNIKVGREGDMGTLSFLGGNVGAVLASRADISVMTRTRLQWGDQLPARWLWGRVWESKEEQAGPTPGREGAL